LKELDDNTLINFGDIRYIKRKEKKIKTFREAVRLVSTLLYNAWGAGIHPKPLQFDAHGLKINFYSLRT